MERSASKDRFGDIWFRARHNALANEVAAYRISRILTLLDLLIAIFIIMPLYSILGLQLTLLTELSAALISLAGTLGALYFSLVGFIRNLRSDLENHKRAHAMFNNIAQKARRGENDLGNDEVKYLLRSLEEMFETAKYNYSEPSDHIYNLGLKRMTNMPKWPFGIPVDKYRKTGFLSSLLEILKVKKT